MSENRTIILKKAEGLFLSYGIRSVTMDDIARELGMSKKTLYQAYENKQAIVEAFVVQFLAESMAAEDAIHRDAKNAVEEMFLVAGHVSKIFQKIPPSAMYDLQKYFHEFWMRCNKLSNEHIFVILKENLERGKEEGLYRTDLNADVVARLYVAQGKVLTDEHFFPSDHFDRPTFFRHMLDYHMCAVTTKKGLDLWKTFRACWGISD